MKRILQKTEIRENTLYFCETLLKFIKSLSKKYEEIFQISSSSSLKAKSESWEEEQKRNLLKKQKITRSRIINIFFINNILNKFLILMANIRYEYFKKSKEV